MCLQLFFHVRCFKYLKVRNIKHSCNQKLNVSRNPERLYLINITCYLQHEVQAPYPVHTDWHEYLKAKRNYQCQQHRACSWSGNQHYLFSFFWGSCLRRNFTWRSEVLFYLLPWRLWNEAKCPQNINIEHVGFFSDVNVKVIDEIHLNSYFRFSEFSYLPAT